MGEARGGFTLTGLTGAFLKARRFLLSLVLVLPLFGAVQVVFPQAAHADDMTCKDGTGIEICEWSGKSTVSGQTGWRLRWRKVGAATWNLRDFIGTSTKTANICMSYTHQEENYEISTLVGSTVGNAYSNTWTYSGSVYTSVSPVPSCINPGEKDITINYLANAPSGFSASGTMASVTAVAVSNFTLAPNGFSVSGRNFLYWTTAANGSGTIYHNQETVDFTNISGTLNLYAQWTTNTNSTVVFNSNYGTPSTYTQSANSSTNLIANTFTRSGYTFSSWNTSIFGSGTSYADGASYSFASNLTLYAVWTGNQYVYNGTTATGSTSSQTYSGTTINAQNNGFTVPSGYNFVEWCTANPVSKGITCASVSGTSYAAGASLPIPSSTTVTLYAVWTGNQYVYNGTTASGSTSSQTYSGATINAQNNGFTIATEHILWPHFGVQFHPESFASPGGHHFLKNFLRLIEC